MIKGAVSLLPGIMKVLPLKGTGGTNDAYYCYQVWLKHMALLWEQGLTCMPETIAELGPGDSIGTGLAAMLSGVNHYYALDMSRYANSDSNLKIFQELLELFRNRTGLPDGGWPCINKLLDDNHFPSHILTDDVLAVTLADERVEKIRDILRCPEKSSEELSIQYMVPWWDPAVIESDTIDMVFSHAVLEHVIDLDHVYQALWLWLKPGAMMSHQIDFESHGFSEAWNGYRTYGKKLWALIQGKRKYLINRQPVSAHINCLKENSFEIVRSMQKYRADGVKRDDLSPMWADITDDDLNCSGCFLQALKPEK